jgi:hypothetical protein
MARKSTRKHPKKAMKLRDLSGKGRTEIRGGATGGAGAGKIKFNE